MVNFHGNGDVPCHSPLLSLPEVVMALLSKGKLVGARVTPAEEALGAFLCRSLRNSLLGSSVWNTRGSAV